MSEGIKWKEKDEDDTAPLVKCAPATESAPPTIIKEIIEMFLRLGFSQTVAMMPVDDQGIYLPQTLASLSDDKIATICYAIKRQTQGSIVSFETERAIYAMILRNQRKVPKRSSLSMVLQRDFQMTVLNLSPT